MAFGNGTILVTRDIILCIDDRLNKYFVVDGLLESCEKRHKILRCKQTNSVTNKGKETAWIEIAQEVSALAETDVSAEQCIRKVNLFVKS